MSKYISVLVRKCEAPRELRKVSMKNVKEINLLKM